MYQNILYLFILTTTDLSVFIVFSILHKNGIINILPENLQEDAIPSTVHILSSAIRNRILKYKGTVNNINTNDSISYGTGIC